jgi:hypothetical protein
VKLILILFFSFIYINTFAQYKFNRISPIGNRTYLAIDLDSNCISGDIVIPHKYSAINLTGQLLAGSALAFIFTLPSMTAAFYNAWSGHGSKESQILLSAIGITSYLIGSATGVYWVAKSGNSELSYWGTVGYSAIGGSVSAILASILASKYTTIPGTGAVIIALCPLISSMVYASFISDWPGENENLSFSDNILSCKDIINYSNLFNLELIHIDL